MTTWVRRDGGAVSKRRIHEQHLLCTGAQSSVLRGRTFMSNICLASMAWARRVRIDLCARSAQGAPCRMVALRHLSTRADHVIWKWHPRAKREGSLKQEGFSTACHANDPFWQDHPPPPLMIIHQSGAIAAKASAPSFRSRSTHSAARVLCSFLGVS